MLNWHGVTTSDSISNPNSPSSMRVLIKIILRVRKIDLMTSSTTKITELNAKTQEAWGTKFTVYATCICAYCMQHYAINCLLLPWFMNSKNRKLYFFSQKDRDVTMEGKYTWFKFPTMASTCWVIKAVKLKPISGLYIYNYNYNYLMREYWGPLSSLNLETWYRSLDIM